MQMQARDSSDPIGEALRVVADVATDHTEDHPLTPELFWVHLSENGFEVRGHSPGADEYGRFFAHVVLDHAVATGVITGNTALHHYWPI